MRFWLGSLLPSAPRHPVRHPSLRLAIDDKTIALRQQNRYLEHRHPHLLDPLRQHPIRDQASWRHQQNSTLHLIYRSTNKSSSQKRWTSPNQQNHSYLDVYTRIHSRDTVSDRQLSMISWRVRRSLGWRFVEVKEGLLIVYFFIKLVKYHPMRLCSLSCRARGNLTIFSIGCTACRRLGIISGISSPCWWTHRLNGRYTAGLWVKLQGFQRGWVPLFY